MKPFDGRVGTAVVLLACAAGTLAGRAGAMSYRPPVVPELGNASQGQLRFYAQPCCYRGPAGKQRVELSYTVGYDQLQLLGDSTGYRGGFTFAVIVYDRHGEQVAGDSWERTIAGRDLPAVQRRDSSVWGTVQLALAPGSYRLAVNCSDANSQRSGELAAELAVPPFDGACALSGIALRRSSGHDTLPWPAARYGDIAAPLLASCEAYCR
ncbi:MAG TPA: hypothetical protein VMF29_01625, partial [Candidatus Edwardsbacteria bacterium]|nr:hypothetical protein [Candidatus Edwardsbacteria bacterium]